MSEQPFVAVVGAANIDIHARAGSDIRLQDSNAGIVHECAGGVARNVAENLARLGVDCRLISAVGADVLGDALVHACRDAGIDTQCILRTSEHRTSTYVSVLDEHGELQVAVNDMQILDVLSPAFLQPHEAMLQQAALVVIDANLPGESLRWLVDHLPDAILFADAVSSAKARRLEPILQGIHSLKASRDEARALTGMDADTPGQLETIGKYLHEKGVGRVFITLGADGVFFYAGPSSDIEDRNPKRPSIANVSGAGDAFLAALVYAWLHRWPLRKSLRFGLSAADVTLASELTNNPELSLAAIIQQAEMQDVGR